MVSIELQGKSTLRMGDRLRRVAIVKIE